MNVEYVGTHLFKQWFQDIKGNVGPAVIVSPSLTSTLKYLTNIPMISMDFGKDTHGYQPVNFCDLLTFSTIKMSKY